MSSLSVSAITLFLCCPALSPLNIGSFLSLTSFGFPPILAVRVVAQLSLIQMNCAIQCMYNHYISLLSMLEIYMIYNTVYGCTHHGDKQLHLKTDVSLYVTQNTHGLLSRHISTSSVQFWEDFPNFILFNETWTHPPTSIVISLF